MSASKTDHHVLVVDLGGEDIDVEHPGCKAVVEMDHEVPVILGYEDCPVDWQIGGAGFEDSFDVGKGAEPWGFESWPPADGRYPIEFWHEEIHIPQYGTEHETGLRRIQSGKANVG